MCRLTCTSYLACALATMVSIPCTAWGQSFFVHAITGGRAISTTSPILMDTFSVPAVQPSTSQPIFVARLKGPGVDSTNDSQLRQNVGSVFRTGDPVRVNGSIVAPGVFYDSISTSISAVGSPSAVLTVGLRGESVDSSSNQGLVILNSNQVQNFHRTGKVYYSGNIPFTVTEFGDPLAPNMVASVAQVTRPTGESGAAALYFLSGFHSITDGLPGQNAMFNTTPIGRMKIAGSNAVTYRAALGGTLVDSTNNEAVVVGYGGQSEIVFRKGAAVGPTTDVFPLRFSDPVGGFLDDGGSEGTQFRAVVAQLGGSGVNASNDRALLLRRGLSTSGPISMPVRTGTQAPGFLPGTIVTSIGDPEAANGFQMYFRTGMSDGRTTLWTTALVGNQVALKPRVVTGSAVFGLSGVLLDSMGDVALGSTGIFAIDSTLTGNVIAGVNDRALLISSPNGLLAPLLRIGQQVRLSSTDVRILTDFAFAPGGWFGSAIPSGNPNIMFLRASFSDGTQAILRAAIPAPSAVLIAGLAGLTATRRRRPVG